MSRFKSEDFNNKLIWEVIFSLAKDPVPNLSYQPLKEALGEKNSVTVSDVREAVIGIRRAKLPDPADIGNAGSFFKNPVVPADLASRIRADYPLMPSYSQDDGQDKIPAGWLIEQCGWKGYRDGAIGVYPRQALVLVNYGGATGEEILHLADRIRESVLARFGISLDREVRVIR
jgi:UDP-N-acetylmuramate dehydrogenase